MGKCFETIIIRIIQLKYTVCIVVIFTICINTYNYTLDDNSH